MRKRVERLARKLDTLIPVETEDIVIICIGTDRSTGDSFGPLVGSYLRKRGMKQVIGTLKDPVHAMNLTEAIESTKGKFIIAVDACLGRESSVGEIQTAAGPLQPGAGVDKKLPPVGDIHIKGIVNIGGYMEYLVLQCTRLALVDEMARITGKALFKVMKSRRYQENVKRLVAAAAESITEKGQLLVAQQLPNKKQNSPKS
ncbi:spore protease YyaC [Paenibacillus larvae]|uniref:spore protease YyaC n=1 Tax=Paenibacillus larvae TaxID=1464 RepID=UPI00288E965C|nr:spore protease YyaC [Paenibacillus larvae]MDT2193824.1 spore protease YyaC [Paenibacillus larvae]MDT2261921.1 spore protease YyaC [Paenibacillus larvae]